MIRARLSNEALDAPALLAGFLARVDRDQGAVVSFVGLARSRAADGGQVTGLFLDHHQRLSEKSLAAIAAAAGKRFAVGAIYVVHRVGDIAPGEPIVWVAAAARHRRAAFEAADCVMDRLKTEAVLWKREDRASGAAWIEPTAADHDDRARWQEGA